MPDDRPTTLWKLAVAAGLLAGLVGIVSLVYSYGLRRDLIEEELPIPEHVAWMDWAGVLLTVLGGALALALLVRRARARAHS